MVLSLVFMGCALGNVMQAGRRPRLLHQCHGGQPGACHASAAMAAPCPAVPSCPGCLQARGALALIIDGVWCARPLQQPARWMRMRVGVLVCGTGRVPRLPLAPAIIAAARQPPAPCMHCMQPRTCASAAPRACCSAASLLRRYAPRVLPTLLPCRRWFFWLGCAAALSADLSSWSSLEGDVHNMYDDILAAAGYGRSSSSAYASGKSRLQAAVAFSWLTWCAPAGRLLPGLRPPEGCCPSAALCRLGCWRVLRLPLVAGLKPALVLGCHAAAPPLRPPASQPLPGLTRCCASAPRCRFVRWADCFFDVKDMQAGLGIGVGARAVPQPAGAPALPQGCCMHGWVAAAGALLQVRVWGHSWGPGLNLLSNAVPGPPACRGQGAHGRQCWPRHGHRCLSREREASPTARGMSGGFSRCDTC